MIVTFRNSFNCINFKYIAGSITPIEKKKNVIIILVDIRRRWIAIGMKLFGSIVTISALFGNLLGG